MIMLAKQLFMRKGLPSIVKRVTQACSLCTYNNLGRKIDPPPLIEPVQRRGT